MIILTHRFLQILALVILSLFSIGAIQSQSHREGTDQLREIPDSPSMFNQTQNQFLITTTNAVSSFITLTPLAEGTSVYLDIYSPEEALKDTITLEVYASNGFKRLGFSIPPSDNEQSYATLMTDFPAQTNTTNTLTITTVGLKTEQLIFNRGYIPYPISTPITLHSPDAALALTILNAATFQTNTYVTVVKNKGLLGPTPDGHIFFGASYSIQTSGDSLANAAMNLTLTYDEIALANVDPYRLAIYGWNTTVQRWCQLGGEVSTLDQTVAAMTRRFTTYILLVQPPEYEDTLCDTSTFF